MTMCCTRPFLALLLALLSISAKAQQPAQKAPSGKTQKVANPLNDLLDEAQKSLDKDDCESAIPPLQKFIAEKSDVAFVHFQLAYALTCAHRLGEARPEYERAIALDPKLYEAWLNLGTLLLSSDPTKAVEPLQKALDLQPAQTRPRYLLAVAFDRSGNETAAAEEFQKLLRLDPNDLPSVLYMGNYELRHHNPAAAESRFRHALEIKPGDQAAQKGLLISLSAQDKPESIDAYRQYVADHPNEPEAKSHLIHMLMDQGKYDEALVETEKLTANQPPSAEFFRLRADILIAQKNTDAAIITLNQAAVLTPNDAQLHGGLGRLYLGKRQFPEAEKELKTALQLDRSNLAYLKDLSSTYYLSGNCAATLASLDAIDLREAPGPGPWFIRALCYDKLNQVQPALAAYRKFLELDENRNPDQVWQANQRIHVLQKAAEKKK
jgi:tetratricopeptide (TPR) repeat protein